MSRTAYFLTAVVLGTIAVFWWFAKWLLIVSYAAGKDSVPGASVSDSGILPVWGIIFLGILLCLLWCLSRAFRPVRRDSGVSPPQTSQPQQTQNIASPDEKLAHLVKKL